MSKKLSVKKSTSKKGGTKKKTIKKNKEKSFLYSFVYTIWIGGIKLTQDRKECITSVDINETDGGSDSAVITVEDPEFRFINDNVYQENKKVKITLGWYKSPFRVKFKGYICAIDIDFGSDGIPIMKITCMDNTYRMNKKKVTKTYKNKTSAQIVKAKCKSYGFKCVIQSGYKFTKQESIAQSNQTDIEFLTQLAGDETYPFTACLVGNTFYYVKKGKLDKKPDISLTYREYPNDIISFSPQINTEVIEHKSGATNTSSKKSNVATGTNKQNKSTDSEKGDKQTKDTKSKTIKTTKTYKKYNNDGTWSTIKK